MAVYRLLCLLPIALLVACDGTDIEALEKEVAQLKKEQEEKQQAIRLQNEKNELISEEISSLERVLNREDQLKEEEMTLSAELVAIEEYDEDLAASKAFLEDRIATWKEATRRSLEGREIGSVRTSEGEFFPEAVVEEVSDDEVTFAHRRGQSTVPIESLPMNLRQLLVHRPTVIANQKIETAP